MSLDERTYQCEVCGLVMDRDLNAALNLEQLITARSAGSNACGEEKFMPALVRDRCSSTKQEPNVELSSWFCGLNHG